MLELKNPDKKGVPLEGEQDAPQYETDKNVGIGY